MKIFTLSLLMAMIAFTSTAQITITAADNPMNIQGNLGNYSNIDTSGGTIAIPQPGEDMVWDYSGISLADEFYNLLYPASTVDVPSANLMFSSPFAILGVDLPGTAYYRYDSLGFARVGYEHAGADLPLVSVTGNTVDTLSVKYFIAENTPRYIIKYPCNYGDSMVTVFEEEHEYVINVAMFGLSNYEINQTKIQTSEYNIKGWGQLILNNNMTMMNDTFEVLLRHRISTVVDSSFDAQGNLVSDQLLNAFGYTQGQTSVYEFNTFYVKGLNGYALSIIVQNGVVVGGGLHRNIFETQTVATDVTTKPDHIAHAIYPNPVQNHQFQIEFEKTSNKDWTFEMVNVLGQRVHQEMFSEGETTIQKTIRLDQSLQKGTYFYAVRDEYGQVVANGRLAL